MVWYDGISIKIAELKNINEKPIEVNASALEAPSKKLEEILETSNIKEMRGDIRKLCEEHMRVLYPMFNNISVNYRGNVIQLKMSIVSPHNLKSHEYYYVVDLEGKQIIPYFLWIQPYNGISGELDNTISRIYLIGLIREGEIIKLGYFYRTGDKLGFKVASSYKLGNINSICEAYRVLASELVLVYMRDLKKENVLEQLIKFSEKHQ